MHLRHWSCLSHSWHRAWPHCNLWFSLLVRDWKWMESQSLPRVCVYDPVITNTLSTGCKVSRSWFTHPTTAAAAALLLPGILCTSRLPGAHFAPAAVHRSSFSGAPLQLAFHLRVKQAVLSPPPVAAAPAMPDQRRRTARWSIKKASQVLIESLWSQLRHFFLQSKFWENGGGSSSQHPSPLSLLLTLADT